MRLSIEEAACQILETLQQRLPDAPVDYESFSETHYFYIEHAGVRFNVRVPETALRRKDERELQPAIQEIVEQVIRITPCPSVQFKPMVTLSFMERKSCEVR